MIAGLSASLPSIHFSARRQPAEGIITSMRPSQEPEFREAGDQFAQYLENLGYTVAGLFDGTGISDKDFVIYEDHAIGGRRFTVTFHHESQTPKIRQADFQEAVEAIAKMDGIEKTGHNMFRLGKTNFSVWMESPNRPLNHWGNDGKTKKAKRETSLKRSLELQGQSVRAPKTAPPPEKADFTHYTQVTIEERDGLHGRQVMLRNQNPNLDGPTRNGLHHKILNALDGISGIKRLGTVSFKLHDVFLSVWSPPGSAIR